MPTNDYLAYAIAGGANVVDQATYAASSYVSTGRGAGILPSNVYNKIARQGSIGSAAIGQLINNVLGLDALDDGNFSTLVTNFTSAIVNAVLSTGDVKPTLKTSADPGFVMANDGTLGNGSSGGTTRANADCLAIFTLLWNNVSNSFAPVSGGRGGSAAADFAANKTIKICSFLGRALASAGSGSGLTARALGSNVGEETHLQLVAELATHSHNCLGGDAGSGAPGTFDISSQNSGINRNTDSQGSSTPFNVMQPSVFVNFMVKL